MEQYKEHGIEYNPYYEFKSGKGIVPSSDRSPPGPTVSIQDFKDGTYPTYDDRGGEAYYDDDYYEEDGYRRIDPTYLGAESKVRDDYQMFSAIQPEIRKDQNNKAYITVDE